MTWTRIASPSGGSIDPALDPSSVDSVEGVTAGFIDPDVAIETSPGRRSSWLFEAIDPATYPQVLAGSPVAIGMLVYRSRRGEAPVPERKRRPKQAA